MTTVNVARQPDRVPDREGSFVSSDPTPGKTPSPAQVRAMAMMEKAREYKEKKIRKEDAVEEPVPRWVELKREIDGTYSTALARLTDGAVDSLSIEHSVRRFRECHLTHPPRVAVKQFTNCTQAAQPFACGAKRVLAAIWQSLRSRGSMQQSTTTT